MRKSATLLIASTLAIGLPLAAVADTVTIDGVTYTDGTSAVFVDSPYAAPVVDDYSDVLVIPGSETYSMTNETYGTVEYIQDGVVDGVAGGTIVDDAYHTVGEAPLVIEYMSGETMDYGVVEQSAPMEAVDGVVYETMVEGEIMRSFDMPVVQTY